MKRARVKVVLTTLVALAYGAAPTRAHAQTQPHDDAIARATRDEMARTMADLKLDKADRPYFVAYTVADAEDATATASFGSLVGSHLSHGRSLTVEVRVGDYALDNTNFFSMLTTDAGIRASFIGKVTGLPLDDRLPGASAAALARHGCGV